MTDSIVTGNDRGVGMALMKNQQQEKIRMGSPSGNLVWPEAWICEGNKLA